MSTASTSQYIFSAVSGGVTWTSANSKAQAQGGHLVAITSQAEEDLVKGVLSSTNNAFYTFEPHDGALNGPWIGLHQPPGSPEPGGGFTWTDGEALSYTDWHSGQPDNYQGDPYVYFWNTGGAPAWADQVNDPTTIGYGPVSSYITEYNDNRTHLSGTSGIDDIIGADVANSIDKVSAGDYVSAGGGNDRISINGTPGLIDGGAGTLDNLVIQAGSTVGLTDANFKNVERVTVFGGSTLDMSGTTVAGDLPGLINSESTTATGGSTIVGTQGRDQIHSGAGGDSITGGTGDDLLFAGSGSDTFHYNSLGFGRDTINNVDTSQDHLDLSGVASSSADLSFKQGGANGSVATTIRINGDTTDSIVLHGVTSAQAQSAGFITYGANEAFSRALFDAAVAPSGQSDTTPAAHTTTAANPVTASAMASPHVAHG